MFDTRVEGKKFVSDVPVVREFPDVFLEDLSGMPHERQVEFKIDMIAGVALIANARYHLASPKM